MNTLKKITLIRPLSELSVGLRRSARRSPSLAAQLPSASLLTARIGERIASELQSRLARVVAAQRVARSVRTASKAIWNT